MVKKIKNQTGGNIPIKPLTTEGRFRYCGKCIMCEKYYNENPGYSPPVYDPSQPDPRTPFKTRLSNYIESIDTTTEPLSYPNEQLLDDEYVLACTCSLMATPSGPNANVEGYQSVFITNYGRLYNINGQVRVNGWYLHPNPYVNEQIKNPHQLTQEYLDIFNNLLNDGGQYGGTLLQLDRSTSPWRTVYNMKLFWMLVDNFNKYQNILMPRDIVDPLAQFRVGEGDQELDEVISALEKSTPVSPKKKHLRGPISKTDFNKARQSLRKMVGSKKKKKTKKKLRPIKK